MNNKKKSIKKMLLSNYKGTTKNLEHIFLNINSTNFDYKRNKGAKKIEKAKYWFFNSSSHLNYSSLFSLSGEIIVNTLNKHGETCISLLCAGGPGFCQSGVSINNFDNMMPCLACYSFNKRKEEIFIEFKHNDSNIQKKTEIQNLQEILNPSLNWILRGGKDSKLAPKLRKKMIAASHLWINFLNTIDKELLPENIILFNGVSFPECVIKDFMEKNNINVITYESAYAENSIYLSNSSATDYEFSFDNNKKLNHDERNELYDYFKKRTTGDFTRSGVKFWNNVNPINNDLKLKINKFDKNIAIFLNVPFDTSQVKASYLFEDMYDWIDSLIEFASENKSVHFIFRSHPDEVRKDKEIFSETSVYINNKSKNCNNISIIAANEMDNSYNLIDSSDLVLTYNSTIGLEAALMEKNVISAGYSHISRLNYFKLFQDKLSYFDSITKALNSNGFNGESSKNQIESYFYQMVFNSSIDFTGIIQKENNGNFNIYKHKVLDKDVVKESILLDLEKKIISEFKMLQE